MEAKAGMQYIRGIPFRDSKMFTKKNIEEAMDYIPHDGDIIIASYPKTGTTWLQYIVLQIISKGDALPSFDDLMYKTAPFIEVTGAAAVDALESPRIYKHHCPYNMVQKNDKAKTLYIRRKPEDTLVSYFHFKLAMSGETLTLDKFFEDFMSGNIAFGRYFEHVNSFLAHKEDENLLLVSYEKIYADRKGETLRIAKFLGDEYYQSLLENEALLEKILEHTSFDYMKQHLAVTRPSKNGRGSALNGTEKVNFFRKGVIGDGTTILSSDQISRLKRLGIELVKDTEVIDEWFKD